MSSKAFISVAALACALAAFADPADDVRAGKGLTFDLKGLSYTYSGILQNGGGVVTDEEAPPTSASKAAGSLDVEISSAALGFPFDVTVRFAGVKVDANTINWTTDTLVNQCITIDLNGQQVQIAIKRITGTLTANAINIAPYFDTVSEQGYNVKLKLTGGDPKNFIDAETYLFCTESSFTRENFKARSIDADLVGGVPRGQVSAARVTVLRGALVAGGLAELVASDDQYLVVRNGPVALPSEAPITLIFDANAPAPTLGSLSFVLENKVSIGNLLQQIDLFSYESNSYTSLDARSGSLTDTVVTVPSSAPESLIEPGTRNMRARLRIRPDGVLFTNNWRTSVDQVAWNVAP